MLVETEIQRQGSVNGWGFSSRKSGFEPYLLKVRPTFDPNGFSCLLLVGTFNVSRTKNLFFLVLKPKFRP